MADYNVIADPAEFAGAPLKDLTRGFTRPQNAACPRAMHLFATGSARLLARADAFANAFSVVLEFFRGGCHEIVSIARTHFDRT